jgi:hypothetical protein
MKCTDHVKDRIAKTRYVTIQTLSENASKLHIYKDRATDNRQAVQSSGSWFGTKVPRIRPILREIQGLRLNYRIGVLGYSYRGTITFACV